MGEQALELTRKAATVLAERGIENARLEAELLLAAVLGVKRLDLYLQHDRPVVAAELDRFRVFVRRRLRREPLQYIVGSASFRRLELRVDARVLIPRSETEVLAGEVLRWATSRGSWGSALDVGTGSGAIALSLASEGGFDRIVATDVSHDALDVARENAQRLGLTVEFRCGPVFAPLADGERFDVIVSNPPYVAERDRATLAPEVREHEPAAALFAGADGLSVLDALVDGAAERLEPGGLLALELGLDQAEAVLARVRAAGGYMNERIVDDLTRRPRIVAAERRVETEQRRPE